MFVPGAAGGIGAGTRRGPQSLQSSPRRHCAYSEPGPPSEHVPSELAAGKYEHVFVHLMIWGGGGGGAGT